MTKNWKKTSIIAFLVTLVIHVMVFLYFNISTLDRTPLILEEDFVLELDYTEEEEIPLDQEQEILEENNQSLTNLMQDVQNIRKKSYTKYSEAEIEQELLEKIAQENAQTVQELRNNGLKGFDPSKYPDQKTKTTPKGEDAKTEKGGNQFAGSVTAVCNVPGRKCYTEKPTYICKGGGRVHVDIRVDKLGRVKQATVNTAKSNTNNECIIQNALDYAKSTTTVNSDLEGKITTDGYIIYNFVSQ